MKTDIIDMVKATPVSKSLERQAFTPTRAVNSGDFSQSQKQSNSSFNQALENHQQAHKEASFSKQRDVLKADTSKEDRHLTAKGEEQSTQVSNAQESAGNAEMEISEEESVELDTITLSTAVQALQQEVENGPVQQLTTQGENETESKIDSLLSLLSKQTDLKVPKLEQYISTMRDAGKSAKEILNTLKTVLDGVGEEKDIDLKDFILKIVFPKEANQGSQQTGSIEQAVTDEKEATTDEKGSKKPLTVKLDIPSDKKAETNNQSISEEKTQITTSANRVKQVISSEAATFEKDMETGPSVVQKEIPIQQTLDAADSSPLEAEHLQLLRDTVRELFGQFNEGLFKNTSKVADSKEAVDNTVDLSEMKIDIPEKFVESLSESLNISKEAIIDFLNSNLIPQEKLQPFIQSFNTSDIQAFIQNNEALLSQMKAFIKLHHHSDSGSKLTLHTRSVTVETTVIKQMILNQFNSKEFSSEWMNSKEPIVFKSPQSVFKVEKLSIRFINKGGQTETSDKSGFKNSDGDFLEKAAQTTKRIFQPTFKNGYETTSQRMTDLERFHAKTSNKESQNEHLANKTGKTISFDEKASLSEKSSETKFQSVSMNEEKDVKGAKSTVDQENQTHQNELKVGRNSTDAVLKNEPSNEAKNLEQVYQKIKDMTQLIARQQTRSELATIKLNPPELGKVSLEVMKEGNKISILMQVETKEAQEILNKNSSALAARLVSSGFELQKVTVQMEKYEEQGENQPNQNGQENSEQQQNENQDTDNNNEYTYEEEYTFADLLKGGIEENAS